MNRILKLLGALFLPLLIPAPSLAAQAQGGGQHFSFQLTTRQSNIGHDGIVDLALTIKINPGWHIYWSNPGESGYAPSIDWTAPSGADASALIHPTPDLLMLGGIASNVHTGQVTLLQNLRLPAVRPSGMIRLNGQLDLLVCSESSCVPDPVNLSLILPAGDGAVDPKVAPLFAQAKAALPRPTDRGSYYRVEGESIKLFIPVRTGVGAKPHVFLDEPLISSENGNQQFTDSVGGVIVTLKAGQVPPRKVLTGVLRLPGGAGEIARGISFSAKPASSLPADRPAFETRTFILALLGAFAGGLVLNLMPCVFPILSLKALALAKAGGDERQARSDAIGYAVGAIGIIMLLGAIILIIRSSGAQLGWAFQLQDPRIIGLLLLLVFGLALNLAGLFELPALTMVNTRQGSFAGSVLTGGLAAFIATPCTGPFMAGALAVALLLPAPASMAVFFGLGFGLATPFLLLGFFRPARRWLPKPGAWMQKLRQMLSIPMFLTAVGLLWILGRQTDPSAMAVALLASLLLALGLWWLGMRQFTDSPKWPVSFPILAAIAMCTAVLPVTAQSRPLAKAEAGIVPYSPGALAALRAERKPVFLYFTADWCLSCKVNEATSLSSAQVESSFKDNGVTIMRGDWTRGDPEISTFLKSRGSAGVPLYLWYAPGREPVELPQVLTPSLVAGLPNGFT